MPSSTLRVAGTGPRSGVRRRTPATRARPRIVEGDSGGRTRVPGDPLECLGFGADDPGPLGLAHLLEDLLDPVGGRQSVPDQVVAREEGRQVASAVLAFLHARIFFTGWAGSTPV